MNRRVLAATGMLVLAASFTVASGETNTGSGASGSGAAATDSNAQASTPAAAAMPGYNQPVRDGKFEFVVKSLKCGAPKVGGQYLEAKAQGQFCLATISVKNIGTEAQTFDASSQEAKNGEITYKADSMASIYANKDPNTFLNQINPGNSVTAVVVFDIPKTGKIESLLLHDSPFSDGVAVKVA